MKIMDWNIEALTGYKPITTFYTDFSIAEPFGESAIKDTYTRAFKHWKKDYKYLTELVMVLNWKCWEHEADSLCGLYILLYERANDYALDNLKGEELKYFYDTTD